jgi:hypothetical protein
MMMIKDATLDAKANAEMMTIIPAAPGFEVLLFYEGYLTEFVVERFPIIAWQVITEEKVCGVITPVERYATVYECDILCPDGKLLHSGDDLRRMTYAQWEAEKKREWQETVDGHRDQA